MNGWWTVPRDVRRLVLAHGLSTIAMGLPWPVLLVAVWESGHSSLWLGVAATARLLPYVLLSWLAGRLADRFDRATIVRVSLGVRLALLLATAVFASTGQVAAAVTCAALVICVGTPAYPALAAEMPMLAGRSNESATGLLVTLEVAGFFVGPSLGGVALGVEAAEVACWAAVGVMAAALWTVLRSSWAHVAEEAPGSDVRAGSSSGVLRLLARRRTARCALVAVALDNAIAGVLAIALLPLAQDAWEAGPGQFGLATSAVGAGAFAAPVLLHLWGLSSAAGKRSSVLMGAALLGIAVSPGLAIAFLPLAAVGAASVHVEAAATRSIQAATPNAARSSVLGLADSVMASAFAVAAGVAPALCAVVGPRPVVAAAAVASIVMRVFLIAPRPATSHSVIADAGRHVAKTAA